MAVDFKHASLHNGLQIIAEVDPEAHTAAMGIFIKAGARDEATKLMGVSHFLEHMMFKGTPRRTADEVNQHFDDIGANYNAFTSHEMTAFWAHVLPEHLPQASDVLTDILRPSLRGEDFTQEKGVILEEIAMYADHPFWVLYEQAMERYYGEHPLSHRVLGTKESIQRMTRDEMAAYFEQRYSADNTVIALAGRVDFDTEVARLGEACGGWARTDAARRYPPVTIKPQEFTDTSEKVNRHYMLAISPAPAVQDDDRYAAGILAQILGDADGSRLYWALVETGLAEDAEAHYDPRDGVGEFYLYASCSPDQADTIERMVLDEAARLPDSLEERDLARVRSKMATSVTLAGERPSGRMTRIGRVWTYTGSHRSLEEELDRINAVTLDDLHRVYEAYPFTPRVVARLTPKAKATVAAGSANGISTGE